MPYFKESRIGLVNFEEEESKQLKNFIENQGGIVYEELRKI